MSEENTAETEGSRAFEGRVFARFDAVDNRLDIMDMRIEKLENKQYDTRPIWEQVLGRLDSMDARMDSFDGRFEAINGQFDAINGQLVAINGRFEEINGHFEAINGQFKGVNTRFDSIDARFAQLDINLDDGFRGIERKMDVLNQYFLDARADQRYLDRRLEKLEEKTKDL